MHSRNCTHRLLLLLVLLSSEQLVFLLAHLLDGVFRGTA
jgi:hypothetical protein